MAKIIIGIGLLLIVLGGVVWLMERAGLTPGRLPGDIVTGRGNVRIYFPIVTSILLSLFLTFVLWLIGSARR